MKAIKYLIIVMLLAFVSVVHAQKRFTINSIYKGKPIVEIAKDQAVQAFIETKSIYQSGMTESSFVNECLKVIPSKYVDLRDIYTPYASFLYSLHKRGLNQDQVKALTTGNEFVDCANGLSSWKLAHPGENMVDSWWRNLIHWARLLLDTIDDALSL